MIQHAENNKNGGGYFDLILKKRLKEVRKYTVLSRWSVSLGNIALALS